MIKADMVIAEALSWLRTPYHHCGRVKGVGADCIGFPATVFAAVGAISDLSLPRDYEMQWHLHHSGERLLAGVESYADKVADPRPADIVLYRYGRAISHAGIVVSWPRIVHAKIGEGVVLADGRGGDLGPRLAGFWRVRGVVQ